ncbi:hypothetical protein GCM10017655_10830 [Pseudomonas turukhanskensis]|uniref:Uncharacterized protein n=1 Tax=Pseudomonas turukhanskensis TaxID=1806536 RepID=A0A9W6K203_9PSED|nr:hypothetical protein GCM10017655_10830 [Pseudomonas turukhanskensis]
MAALEYLDLEATFGASPGMGQAQNPGADDKQIAVLLGHKKLQMRVQKKKTCLCYSLVIERVLKRSERRSGKAKAGEKSGVGCSQ